MRDVSIVQKIVTWTVVIMLIILGISVILKKDKVIISPVPTIVTEPTIYPCLAGDKCI